MHTNIRLEEDRQCIPVLIGATPDEKRKLLWNVQRRALTVDPKLAIGDGALGLLKGLGRLIQRGQA